MVAIAKGCISLRAINLSECLGITDKSLDAISKVCFAVAFRLLCPARW